MIALSGHPRARRDIRRARAGGGLAVALLVAVLAHRAGVPGEEVVLRALAAGVVGHLVAWACAIGLYRALAKGEIQVALDRRAERVAAAKAAAERERAKQD